MYFKKHIGGGRHIFYGKQYPSAISIEDEYGGILAITTVDTVLKDAKTLSAVTKPSFWEWLRSQFNVVNPKTAGSRCVFLRERAQFAYVFRYSVRIGCTEFTNKQIDRIIKYALKFKS